MFYTKDKYQWVKDSQGYNFCQVAMPDGSFHDLKFHKGVSKILQKGEPTLKDKLIAQYGEEEGAAKAEAIYARGSKRHAKIEDNINALPKALLNELPEIVAQEVLLWHSNLKDNKVIGFADAITKDKDGNYNILDFKTKKSRKAYQYYNPQETINKAFTQMVFYAILAKETYGIQIQQVQVAVLFIEDSEDYVLETLHRDAFMPYANEILRKLKK